jgi:hypothetical protein
MSTATTLHEAAQQALRAIDAFRDPSGGMPAATGEFDELSAAGVLLEQVLALPEPDPIAWLIRYRTSTGQKKTALVGHNAIGDYRLFDATATSTPLRAPAAVITAQRLPADDSEGGLL